MADWRKAMFCNESISRLILRGYNLSLYTVLTVMSVGLQESPDMTPGTSSRL